MKLSPNVRRLVLMVLLCCALPLCGVLLGDEKVTPIEDLRLPLEHYEDGRIKTQLIAGLAKVPPQGDIEASDVRVEFYRENGDSEARMFVEECRYMRTAGMVTSESNVRMEREDIVITGTGLEWNAKEQIVKILDNAKVVLKRAIKKKDGSSTRKQSGSIRPTGRSDDAKDVGQ